VTVLELIMALADHPHDALVYVESDGYERAADADLRRGTMERFDGTRRPRVIIEAL